MARYWMKTISLAVICLLVGLMAAGSSLGYQDVGSEYGTSWLQKYGTMPTSTLEQNSLWNWGNAPKGFGLHDGVLYPPGTEPQWYYPSIFNSYTPIVINKTDSRNLQSSYGTDTDPWLIAQLYGRPVAVVKDPPGTLF